jgi:hypothetical protein
MSMTPVHVRAIVSLLVIATVSACGAGGYDPAKYAEVEAEVEQIDRTCMMRTYERTFDGKEKPVGDFQPGDCYDDKRFQAMRDHPDSNHMTVDGSAEMALAYRDPTSNRMMHGTLQFSGRDAEFYAVNAHDRMKILVSKSDPKRIRKL